MTPKHLSCGLLFRHISIRGGETHSFPRCNWTGLRARGEWSANYNRAAKLFFSPICPVNTLAAVNPEPAALEAVPPIIASVREEAPPVARIEALDVLRGFAVLGILVMNIQSFTMIEAAYMNPAAYGDLTGINRWVWVVSHVFADQKFMSIFSLLFGAGIVLMTDKSQASGKSAGWLHYRRMFWLLVVWNVGSSFSWCLAFGYS